MLFSRNSKLPDVLFSIRIIATLPRTAGARENCSAGVRPIATDATRVKDVAPMQVGRQTLQYREVGVRRTDFSFRGQTVLHVFEHPTAKTEICTPGPWLHDSIPGDSPMDVHEILPELFLDGCPRTSEDVDALVEQGITAVLSLQTDDDLAHLGIDWDQLHARYSEVGIEARRVPIRDFDDDDLRDRLPEGVRVLEELLNDDQVVYVHCTAGVNRSPSVVICYLYWSLGWCVAEAERHVRKRHPCAPMMEVIRLATRDRQRAKE
jgi:protein-tyrosine phosphatase